MTGSVQAKNGKWWLSVNKVNNQGKREEQLWFNTYLPERGNKKRAAEMLNELIMMQPTIFTSKFVLELKCFLKANASKIADRHIHIPYLIDDFVKGFDATQKQDVELSEKSNLNFLEMVSIYIETKKETVAQYTHSEYQKMNRRRVTPYFLKLGLKVHEVKPKHIKDFLAYVKTTGLCTNSIIKYYTLLRAIFSYAIKKRIILENPTDDVPKPKTQPYSSEFYSKDEMNRLIEVSKGTKLETVIMIACYFGFRRSEVLGLKWDAVDFNSNMVTVKNKVLMIYDEKLKTNVPIGMRDLKTDTSRRSLPMGESIRNYLLSVKEKQEADAAYYGNSYDMVWDGYVCRNEDGGIVKPEYVTTMFPRMLKRYGLKEIRFHDLRHSCATMLLQSGFNMREVQEWMGHADYSTTAKIYAHVDHKNKASMAYSQDSMLFTTNESVTDEKYCKQEKDALIKAAKSMLKDGLSIRRVSEFAKISEQELVSLLE